MHNPSGNTGKKAEPELCLVTAERDCRGLLDASLEMGLKKVWPKSVKGLAESGLWNTWQDHVCRREVETAVKASVEPRLWKTCSNPTRRSSTSSFMSAIYTQVFLDHSQDV